MNLSPRRVRWPSQIVRPRESLTFAQHLAILRRMRDAFGEGEIVMSNMRKETDSLGVVEVPADRLWGAQTQRSLEDFSIGKDLIPREMITAYAILKKAAAATNHSAT